MPKYSKKKEIFAQKKGETTNMKRKRTEDDVDNKTSSKKIKIGWLRDIKAVLRSAGNRLVHIDGESKINRSGRKSNKGKRRGTDIISHDERVDEVGLALIENSDTPMTNEDLYDETNQVANNDKLLYTSIDNTKENLKSNTKKILETNNFSTKQNIQNELEESCTFQQLQYKASGTMIKLENVLSSDTHQNPNCVELDKFNQSDRRNANNADITTNDIEIEPNTTVDMQRLIDLVYDNDEIERENEQYDFPALSTNIIEATQRTKSDLPTTDKVKDSVQRFINGIKNHSYFFGTDSTIDNNSNAGFIFASNQSNQRALSDTVITGTNDVDMDMNAFEIVESHRSERSDSNQNLSEYWLGPCRGDCANENGYLINGPNEYQIQVTDNNTTVDDSEEMIQDKIKFPITQAYYDSNKGAYVDPLTLQDSKAHNASNTFKNTWGSIRNLISRVSGNKGSGDVQENQEDEMLTQTEEDRNS